MKKRSHSALQLWLTLASIPVLAVVAVYIYGALTFDDNAIIEIDNSLSKDDMNRIPDTESLDLDREFTAPLDQPMQNLATNQQPSLLTDLPAQSNEQTLSQMLSEKNKNLKLGSNGHPMIVRVQENDNILSLASRHLGNSIFWPYLFMVNKEKLPSPNALKAGMTLYLPDSAYYDMNLNDTLAIKKAEEIAKNLQ